MGVEPTRDRLTAPTGFEVRPPHRERFSSGVILDGLGPPEQVEPIRADLPQIAAANGDAMPVEELQHLDRDLAAAVDLVAEGGGAKAAVGIGRGQLAGDGQGKGGGRPNANKRSPHIVAKDQGTRQTVATT